MATFRGTDGIVKVGSATVAEVQAFTVDLSAAIINDNAMGDEWDTHLKGRKSWSGTISCMTDPTDATGQVALAIGTGVALKLYPVGDISATGVQVELAGDATITGISYSSNHDNTVATCNFTFTGNGACTETRS